MKKTLKIFLVISLMLSLVFCLCSCIDLDAIRQTRISYSDENQTEVEFLGKTYKQLDKRIGEYLYSYDLNEKLYAAKEDVPLLLTQMYSAWATYNSDDTRLIDIEGIYYCREDIYDYATDLLDSNEFDYLCMTDYDVETRKDTVKMLDESLIQTVDIIILTVEPMLEYTGGIRDTVSIMATDKTALFMHDLFRVEKLEYGYAITMDNLSNDIYGYMVPAIYNYQFENLFSESEDYGNFEEDEEYEDFEDYEDYKNFGYEF